MYIHQNLMFLDGMNTAGSANGPPSDAIKCQLFSTHQHVDWLHTRDLHCD